jgi:hypothetical protein
MENELELTPEEEIRLVLRSAIPDLPEAVRSVMLADPAILSAMGLPTGDFIRLWDKRFHRNELFETLREIANGRPATLASADRTLTVEEGWLDEDGAGVLRADAQAARFVNVALLSDDLKRRSEALAAIAATGELAADREALWWAMIDEGPLDDPHLIELETELGASPEAAFRVMAQDITEGQAHFNDIVPLELTHYAGLLAVAPSDDLDGFATEWLSAAGQLNRARLLRLLTLSGPLSMLKGALVAQASDHLPEADRLALAQLLRGGLDPFSVVAAFEIACRHRGTPEMLAIANEIVPRLFDREDPLIAKSGAALVSTAAITTALTARYRTLAEWPLYAQRLGRYLHASHLLRLFSNTNVDPVIFEDQAMRSFAPQAQLADLCNTRDAPVWQPRHFNTAMIHAIVLARVTAAIAEIPEDDRPKDWLTAGEQSLASSAGSEWGLFLFAPTPFSELHEDWSGLILMEPDSTEEARMALNAKDNLERSLSDLIKLSVAFEIPADLRPAFAKVLPPFVETLDGTNFVFACEVSLQLAARWRDPNLADAIVDLALKVACCAGLADAGAAPRLMMLAAAVEHDPARWRKRTGNLAQSFAFAQKAGSPTVNLMRALELLRDFQPDLGPDLSSARSYASLAFDRLPANEG